MSFLTFPAAPLAAGLGVSCARRVLPAKVAIVLTLTALTPGATALVAQEWLAFDANFVRTEPGQRQVVGWFHRGADGSTREESNADGPARPVVLIMNVARRLQYRFEDKVWSSYPVHVPPNGWHPQRVDRDPRKYLPAADIEKVAVFRFVNPEGHVLFVAPSLNDFALRTERGNGGREVFSNIVIREQPAGLFEPPPGVFVSVHSDGASGVIYYPAGQMPATR
jgi:hypothetical protein